jgi:hypothetical protein
MKRWRTATRLHGVTAQKKTGFMKLFHAPFLIFNALQIAPSLQDGSVIRVDERGVWTSFVFRE